MRSLIVVAVLTGCSPDGPSLDLAPGEAALDGEIFLDDDVDELAERARVRTVGAARLLPDGEAFHGERDAFLHGRLLTVVEPGPSPRVSWQNRQVQLLLYPDADDLHDVAWQDTVAIGDPADPTDAGVEIGVGTVLEVLDHREGHLLVTYETDELVVEAWAPDAHVDRWYPQRSHPRTVERPDGEHAMLVGDAVIVDRPGGEALAWPRDADEEGTSWVSAVVTGPEERGWRPVWVQDDGTAVTGWVHVDDLDFEAIQSRGFGRCGGCGLFSGLITGTRNVPAQTRLHASPNGPVVGRTLQAAWVSGDPTAEWVPYEVDTPWGTAVTWLTLW